VVPLSRYLVFFSVASGGCAVDLATKHWIFARLGVPKRDAHDHIWWLWDRVFGFQTSLNEGALFGMGQGMWAVFAVLSIIAALGILLWLFVVGAANDWWLTVALALITAGILGNLYDRFGLPGLVWPTGYGHQVGEPVHAVRDFILMAVGRWHWPNYNIADSMLVCGATMLLGHAFFTARAEGGERKADATGEERGTGGEG
jgi:signal peptidase II